MCLCMHATQWTSRIELCAEDETQHTASLVVDNLHWHLTLASLLKISCAEVIVVITEAISLGSESVGVATHLKVKTELDSLVGVVACTPVGDDCAIEAPLALEDLVQETLIVRYVLILILVVAAHEAPCVTLLDCSLERTEIEFIESSVGNLDIDMTTELLLVVEHIVLDAASHAIALQACYIWHNHDACEIRVLAHIFEVTAIERCAIEIDTRTKQNALLAIASLLSYVLAIKGRHLWVPCRCKAGESRESCAIVVGPVGMCPVVPVDLHAHTMRTVACPQFRNTEASNAWA